MNETLRRHLELNHEEAKSIAKQLVKRAKTGYLPAIREVFDRIDGKPVERRVVEGVLPITLIFKPARALTTITTEPMESLPAPIEGEAREIPDQLPPPALETPAEIQTEKLAEILIEEPPAPETPPPSMIEQLLHKAEVDKEFRETVLNFKPFLAGEEGKEQGDVCPAPFDPQFAHPASSSECEEKATLTLIRRVENDLLPP